MASANLPNLAEFARSLELNALSLSHLTFTTTIRTCHIFWIALLSRVSTEYFLLNRKSTAGIRKTNRTKKDRKDREGETAALVSLLFFFLLFRVLVVSFRLLLLATSLLDKA
jgi:hypothetical protein